MAASSLKLSAENCGQTTADRDMVTTDRAGTIANPLHLTV